MFFISIYALLLCQPVLGQYKIETDSGRSLLLSRMYLCIGQEKFLDSKVIALQHCRDKEGAFDYPFMHGLITSCSNLGQIDTCYILMNQIVCSGNYSVLDRLILDFQLEPLLRDSDSIDVWQRKIDSIYFYRASLNNPAFNHELAKEILDIYTKDQWPRSYDAFYYFDTTNKYNRDSALIAWLITDSINQKLTSEILDKHGWPSPQMVGFDLAQAIWYPVQHGSVAFQKKYRPLVNKAFRNGYILPSLYAGFVDRLAINQGKKQLYGTQFTIDEGGKWIQSPIKRKCFLRRRLRKINML